MPTVDALVREKARALGFDAVAVARADVPLDNDFAHYRAFLDQGMYGEMGWLANNASVRERVDTDHILPGAKSVVCLARRYSRSQDEEAADPPLAQTFARYARGRDYHNGVRKKLRRLAAYIRTFDQSDDASAGKANARPICDDAPVLERAWAARAGLGFVGKNGLLIVPGQGSLVLLGEVVTTLALTPDSPIPLRCGACTRCLDVCPTQAFARPFVLDPRKCVAYLTIEHRSGIDPELRAGVGDHAFGCDDCQTVCPFNGTKSRDAEGDAQRPFEPHERWSRMQLADFLGLTQAEWDEAGQGTPVRRATREGMARNAAIVLGNRREEAAKPALLAAVQMHDSANVRDAAAWALARINDTNDTNEASEASETGEKL